MGSFATRCDLLPLANESLFVYDNFLRGLHVGASEFVRALCGEAFTGVHA